jgi:hypothetical protein
MNHNKVQKAVIDLEGILLGLRGARVESAVRRVEELIMELRGMNHTKLPTPDGARKGELAQ